MREIPHILPGAATAILHAASIEFALSPEGPWTDAKSPVKVMRVKAPRGATLHFRVSGEDEATALDAVLALVRDRFGEE